MLAALSTILAVVGIFYLLVLVFYIYGMLSWGFVIYKFSGWFLLSKFGIALTFGQALVIAMIIGIFVAMTTRPTNESIKMDSRLAKKYKWQKLTIVLIMPWAMLIILWAITFFL